MALVLHRGTYYKWNHHEKPQILQCIYCISATFRSTFGFSPNPKLKQNHCHKKPLQSELHFLPRFYSLLIIKYVLFIKFDYYILKDIEYLQSFKVKMEITLTLDPGRRGITIFFHFLWNFYNNFPDF